MQVFLRLTLGSMLTICVCFLPILVSGGESEPLEAGNAAPAPPAEPPAKSGGLLDLSLDQLSKVDVMVPSLNMAVTTVSREESTVGRSAAAIFVITPEMIRRSGVRRVPDALRMVPGLEVANINQNTWAITARGFNDRFSNKLLVQIDGRVVYSPLFGGVYWEAGSRT